ncbi:Ankyrin repeat-containing protein [Artemisia annua]|uniref:Ankyrin repeat-containing protein n=1 Tax=Artemisia annua TaxID=35608 RepID=A0A2U1PQ01_ARTAN|nr:Ankyrin repeat-containing protein [Artemisia annua]
MTFKKVAELDAEFIVYKAEAKERMDALEKKFDEGIGKLDGGIGLLKSEVDQKFEELKQLILSRAPTQASPFEFSDPTKQTSTLTSTFEVPDPTKLATKPNPYVPPARRGYDDIGLELHNSNGESSTTIGKNLRPEYWDAEDRSNSIKGKQMTLMGMQRWEFGVDLQATDTEMQHMMGTHQTGEIKHRGAGTNQAGDRFAYHGFEHRMRKLKMPLFEGEDAYGWIYRVERYFEIQGIPQQEQLRAAALCMEGEALSWYRWSEGRTPFHSWDGFKRRLLIRFQQSQEGNLYEQYLAITQKESARAYVALFEKLACQLVGVPETVMEATFTKGLKPALRAAVRVMNPASLNHAMELAVTIEDNRLYEGVMQSKGVAAIVGQTSTKGFVLRTSLDSRLQILFP